MNQKTSRTVRLGPEHERELQRLCKKLHMDATNVIRLAITKLHELEGL